MDSLLLLCARRIIAHNPLPAVPAGLYPVLFQVAFQDETPDVLQDLVSTWPFPELNFQQLVGSQELLQEHLCNLCIPDVIQAVVMQLKQDLEEPGRNSRCRLRVLDITGLPGVWGTCAGTMDLAEACVEVSKHQQEFQCRRSNQHKGPSGAATAVAAPQPPGVDIHTDLFVTETSYDILWDALQIGAASLLRLKCREFHGDSLSLSSIMKLLKSLDPSCVRRVSLPYNHLGLNRLTLILPHLSRFPELHSLKLKFSDIDLQHLTPESAIGIQCLARQLGMLPSLQELNLAFSRLSGNLHQIIFDLQAPLESLELAFCSLLPADFAFLSQSFHAQALKRLDLSGHDFSQSLLEPLRLLLEETSASLLYLNLWYCRLADSHLDALLPTILRCSHLRFLGLYGNSLSTAALKDLHQKLLELPDLRLVVYPVPVDCYKLGEDEPLAAVSAEISQMLENSRRTDLVWTYNLDEDEDQHRALDYFSL